jgi:DNA-binding CsgD family transcriptional regulator
MTGRTDSDFIDLVYETAFAPALWPEVMTQLADMIGASGGWLSQLSCIDGSGGDAADPLARIDPIWMERYVEHYAGRNPIAVDDNPRGYLESWRLITRTVDDEINREDLRRSEFYHDWLAPQDIASSMLIRLARRGAETATLNINCSHKKDRFSPDEIDMVARHQPHLVRAFELGRRLAEARQVEPTADGLFEGSHHGLFLVDRTGRIRRVNPVGEAMIVARDGLVATAGRLGALSPAANRQLQALIAGACGRAERTGGGMTVASATRAHGLSLSVVPVRAERAWPFHLEPAALVCATDLGARADLPEQQIRRIFGLTAAETRVAMAIAQGDSLAELAGSLGISINTVNNHLARIFDKTETRRQAQLASLLMRLIATPTVAPDSR